MKPSTWMTLLGLFFVAMPAMAQQNAATRLLDSPMHIPETTPSTVALPQPERFHRTGDPDALSQPRPRTPPPPAVVTSIR